MGAWRIRDGVAPCFLQCDSTEARRRAEFDGDLRAAASRRRTRAGHAPVAALFLEYVEVFVLRLLLREGRDAAAPYASVLRKERRPF